MEDGDLIELKFRLADGKDIGPSMYSPAITVASLKEKILAQWPKDKENSPKTINEVKLINAGRILDNDRTLAQCRVKVGELPGVVTTMHVLVCPPLPEKKIEKQPIDSSKTPRMSARVHPSLNWAVYAKLEDISSGLLWHLLPFCIGHYLADLSFLESGKGIGTVWIGKFME